MNRAEMVWVGVTVVCPEGVGDMESAIVRMQEAAEKHRNTHPGHVVVEDQGTDTRGAWAIWTCKTCREISKVIEED